MLVVDLLPGTIRRELKTLLVGLYSVCQVYMLVVSEHLMLSTSQTSSIPTKVRWSDHYVLSKTASSSQNV